MGCSCGVWQLWGGELLGGELRGCGEKWGRGRCGVGGHGGQVPEPPVPQARNEPDVYETSDLPEDDQAEFEAVRRPWAAWKGTGGPPNQPHGRPPNQPHGRPPVSAVLHCAARAVALCWQRC